MLRKLAERFSRGRVFKRRLPAQYGGLPLFVSPDSQLKYLKPGLGGFDRGLLDAATRLVGPGDNVWDVGANVGVFTMASAGLSRSGQIVAVEADIWLAELIRMSARLHENAGFDIAVLPAAAFAISGIAEFTIAARGRASNHLSSVRGRSQTGGERDRIYVPTLALDSLLENFRPPDLVKIDVEGAEIGVLEGMSKVLSEVRPKLYFEISHETESEARRILEKYEYVPCDIRSRKRMSVIDFNTLFLPVEQL